MFPLHSACAAGRVDDARRLLDGGADVDAFDNSRRTPIISAIVAGHIDVLRLCLDRGANVDGRMPGAIPVEVATANGSIDMARLLLDRGADVNQADDEGWTSLYVASYENNIEAARLCLERGADPNQATFDGSRPHDAAREGGYVAMATWLSRIRRLGWTRYLSEPRYKLVVLRAMCARGLARRRRADPGEELLLDFLFPSDQPRRRAKRQPRLPDELFSIIVRCYWGGGLSGDEEAVAAAVAAEDAEEESSDSEDY